MISSLLKSKPEQEKGSRAQILRSERRGEEWCDIVFFGGESDVRNDLRCGV